MGCNDIEESKTALGEMIATNKANAANRTNAEAKKTKAQILGLGEFGDPDWKEIIKEAEEAQAKNPSNYNYGNARGTRALYRDFNYATKSRRYLYAMGLANKQRVQFIGPAVALAHENALKTTT